MWCGCIEKLLRGKVRGGDIESMSGRLGDTEGDWRWRAVAVVEWESSAKVDPITSLPFSVRKQGRVWKSKGVSAVGPEVVDRVLGYFDMKIGRTVVRRYVDTDRDYLRLGDPRSRYQLHSVQGE